MKTRHIGQSAAGMMMMALCFSPIVGCSDASAPETQAETEGMEMESSLSSEEIVVQKKMRLSPMGAELKLEGATLTFPPGAVAQEVDVQVTKLADNAASAAGATGQLPNGVTSTSGLWVFEPHGLGFTEPVTVNLAYAPSGGLPSSIGRLENLEDPTWKPVTEPVHYGNSQATFRIGSFSVYSVVSDSGGVLASPAPPVDSCLAGSAFPVLPSSGDGTCGGAGPYMIDLTGFAPGEVATFTTVPTDTPNSNSSGNFGLALAEMSFQVTVLPGDTFFASASSDAGVGLAVDLKTEPGCVDQAGMTLSYTTGADANGCFSVTGPAGAADGTMGVTTDIVVDSSSLTEPVTIHLQRM